MQNNGFQLWYDKTVEIFHMNIHYFYNLLIVLFQGPNGEFILLVSCKDEGVKVFQYDGWRFIESEVQYTGEAFGSGILNMYSHLFYNEPIIGYYCHKTYYRRII